jgi:hypothetical protein
MRRGRSGSRSPGWDESGGAGLCDGGVEAAISGPRCRAGGCDPCAVIAAASSGSTHGKAFSIQGTRYWT